MYDWACRCDCAAAAAAWAAASCSALAFASASAFSFAAFDSFTVFTALPMASASRFLMASSRLARVLSSCTFPEVAS